MRCGILIIGSLLWDEEKTRRRKWRTGRLNVGEQTPVRAPIHYGRKSVSRGKTFTMAFRRGEPTGQGVLVPCIRKIGTIDDLIEEARVLWRAEDESAKPKCIHKSWGCVGAEFGTDAANLKLAADWTAYFQKVNAQPVSVVNTDGILEIAWPSTPDGSAADFDVILATATKPEMAPPTPRAVADAWIAQGDGFERYFFENVRHGIRTPDDGDIWKRIEERLPPWLKTSTYERAVEILRAEAKTRDQQ